MAVFTNDGEAECYLVFHEQGRDGLLQQFPRHADLLLRAWGPRGLIVTDGFGERADRAAAVETRLDLEVRAPTRMQRIRDLHHPDPTKRPQPRDMG